ncbi:DeoR/GlpR family DNA-binding transcription regulator [Paenibacillus sp.]|uniref:DeoR/GlpR family DNA-binding transcription regulator n=1 Tax=Paenibacillus sp. TaxID=58172 RepID=UPI002D2E2100|nr:DeoR/GlpR family DNA-binding transcription regulator [Paenibacillus sp.]HZG87083.1 DeoR/GlpR family DNA-binding transcription regulator [Paenibacillus sp.]
MIVIQRRNKIKERLLQERSVKVADLVQEFNVSEETIRRDLHQLEQEGLIKKNYGGAILLEEFENVVIPPVQQRTLQHFEEKDAIGKKAAEMVEGHQIVIIDAGSTTWCMARYLKDKPGLVVVTNGINVAEQCSENEEAQIFLLGGKLIRKSKSLVGPQAEMELHKYNAHYAFMGASGVSERKGFTSLDIYEAEIKRAMIAAGQKVVVLADHSKFQRQGLVSFSSFRDVDMLITSSLTDAQTIKHIREMGVEVVVCPVEAK